MGYSADDNEVPNAEFVIMFMHSLIAYAQENQDDYAGWLNDKFVKGGSVRIPKETIFRHLALVHQIMEPDHTEMIIVDISQN